MNTIQEFEKLQEKHRKQMRENRQKEKERKARTHRLIVRGAIAEAFVEDAETLTDSQFQEALAQRIKGYKQCAQTVINRFD